MLGIKSLTLGRKGLERPRAQRVKCNFFFSAGHVFPALAGFPNTSRWRNNVCVSHHHHESDLGRIQKAEEPDIPDGSEHFSMAWGTFLINLEPATG